MPDELQDSVTCSEKCQGSNSVDNNVEILSAEHQNDVLTSPSAQGIVNIEAMKQEFLLECNRRAYLDGTYFLPKLDTLSLDGSVKAVCQLCHQENDKQHIICGSLKVSSNYVSHIKKIHARKFEEYEAYAKSKAKKLKTEHVKNEHRTYCSFSQGRFEENVIKYVLESLVPLNTVESPAFRNIFDDMKIKKQGKVLQHLSARSITRRILQSFQASVAGITAKMATIRHVCTTADTWSSLSRRFIGMTVHWIDDQTLQRKSYAIACQRLTGTHSYDRIAQVIGDLHKSYGLEESKVMATVTDNGSNFVKAFLEFGLHFGDSFFHDGVIPTSSIDDGGEEPAESDHASIETFEDGEHSTSALPQHLRCASHTLNLIATTDMLAGIRSCKNLDAAYNGMIAKCNDLWNCLRSPKKREKLHEVLGQSLKRPVVTRWNSLYDAVKQILSLKELLVEKGHDLDIPNPLRETDFRFMKEYVDCNKPIAEGLDMLQGENKCYYGYLLPTLISIRNKLHSIKNSNPHWCNELVEALLDGLNRRFQKIFDVDEEGRVSAVAAATHPAFKLKWMQCLTPLAQRNVLSALKDAFPCVTEETEKDVPKKKKDNDFFDFSCPTDTRDSTEHIFGSTDVEAIYQKFASESRSDFVILNSYPVVKKAFIKFNTPLPSSAAVERLFSYATMFNLPKYNKLTDENFEMRVLMKCNSNAACD